MIAPLLLLLAFVAPVFVFGAPLVWRAGRNPRVADGQSGQRGLRLQLVRTRDALVAELGPTAAAVAIGLAGLAAVVAVCWPFGGIAASLEGPLDRPFFAWSQQIYDSQSGLATVAALVTQMGDAYPLIVVVACAAVAFAVLWRHRDWWVPPVLLVAALAAELTLQRLLILVVDRGHPPTALGTYPSGGIARLITVGGVIVFLVLLTWPQLSARTRAMLWLNVALLSAIEGFTRIYLLQHWLSDLVGGWLFGLLLLVTLLASASALTSRRGRGQTISAAS